MWDRYVEDHKSRAEKLQTLERKSKYEKSKTKKASLLADIKSLKTTKYTHEQMCSITPEDCKFYMDKYFEVRKKDYLIQSYTRYGESGAADLDILSEFLERNDQFRGIIVKILEEIGIPHPGFASNKTSQMISLTASHQSIEDLSLKASLESIDYFQPETGVTSQIKRQSTLKKKNTALVSDSG